MSKSIVFVSIFDLTHLFHELAGFLSGRGHRISWITTSRTWTNWLRDRGVAEVNILSLIYGPGQFLSEAEKVELSSQIVRCEAAADISINQCLLMDRFVGRRFAAQLNEYVYLYYRDIKRFLVEKGADIVVAEPTNLNELITYMICRELGVRFLAPGDMRYPPGRVIFTEGYLQGQLVGPGSGDVPTSGDELLTRFREERTRPAYFERLNRRPVVTFSGLYRTVRNRLHRREFTRQPNLTHHSVWSRAEWMLRRVINGFYLRHLTSYDSLGHSSGKVAFFGLHVQPEASIDVRGAYFSDQLKLIKDIRRALPFDVTLLVKEHPNFLGIRGKAFMDQIRSIPNTRLIRHDVPSVDILMRASLVFTVSGTVAYEAGMLGVPAVCFSPIYFGALSSVFYCGEITNLRSLVQKIMAGYQRDYAADCKVMGELVRRSFPGRWIDPYNDPSVLEPENLQRLNQAFMRVVEDDSC